MRLKSFPFGPDDTGVAPEPTDAVGGEAATTMRVRSLPFGGDIVFWFLLCVFGNMYVCMSS